MCYGPDVKKSTIKCVHIIYIIFLLYIYLFTIILLECIGMQRIDIYGSVFLKFPSLLSWIYYVLLFLNQNTNVQRIFIVSSIYKGFFLDFQLEIFMLCAMHWLLFIHFLSAKLFSFQPRKSVQQFYIAIKKETTVATIS